MKKNLTLVLSIFTIATFVFGTFAVLMFAQPASQTTGNLQNTTATNTSKGVEFVAGGTTNATITQLLDILIITCNSTSAVSRLESVPGIAVATGLNDQMQIAQVETGKKGNALYSAVNKALADVCEPSLMQAARLSFDEAATVNGKNESERYVFTVRDLNRIGSTVSLDFLKMADISSREGDQTQVYITALISNGVPTRMNIVEVPNQAVNFAQAETKAIVKALKESGSAALELKFAELERIRSIEKDAQKSNYSIKSSNSGFKALFKEKLDTNEVAKITNSTLLTYLDNQTLQIEDEKNPNATVESVSAEIQKITSKSFEFSNTNETLTIGSNFEAAVAVIDSLFGDRPIKFLRQATLIPVNETEFEASLKARVSFDEFDASISADAKVNSTVDLSIFAITRGKSVAQINAVEKS